MEFTFFAEDPATTETCAVMSRLTPENPFYTPSYAQAQRDLGLQPILFGLRQNDTFAVLCPGFLRSGRLNCALEIPSLPSSPGSDTFWRGLLQFCRRRRVAHLAINTFCSPSVNIPEIGLQLARTARSEYILRLQEGDLLQSMHKEHRRLSRRAAEVIDEIRETADAAHCSEHVRVIEASMRRRRERGEEVPDASTTAVSAALLQNGAGRLFQALAAGDVRSSILVITSPTGAYMHSAGTSREGMACGASHFLIHKISCRLREQGLALFNLGGTESRDSGLAEFKVRFGASVVDLEAAEFYLHSAWRRKVEAFLKLLLSYRHAVIRQPAGSINR
jgi:hypothetical protein